MAASVRPLTSPVPGTFTLTACQPPHSEPHLALILTGYCSTLEISNRRVSLSSRPSYLSRAFTKLALGPPLEFQALDPSLRSFQPFRPPWILTLATPLLPHGWRDKLQEQERNICVCKPLRNFKKIFCSMTWLFLLRYLPCG